MTDFEEINVPNSDEGNSSIDSCEEITIPDEPDPYGGKDCPCDCHITTTEAKMLNRSRHCVKCGIKFIDGRIYIQTGKVLKPAQVIYHKLPPETRIGTNNIPQISPPLPNSSDVSPKQSEPSDCLHKQEPCALQIDDQRPLLACDDEILLSSSKLPCDVIEDTVFPTVATCAVKSVPPDFSRLRDMICSSNEKEETINSNLNKNTSENKQLKELDAEHGSIMLSKSSIEPSNQRIKWTRDEDKLIIYNCQRFGISEKAFQSSASALETKSAEEVEERFSHLMKFISKDEIKK